MRRESIIIYFRTKCTTKVDNTRKEFWKTIRPFFTENGTYDNNSITLKDNDNIITSPADVSELFNQYFAVIGENTAAGKIDLKLAMPIDYKSLDETFKDHDSIKQIKEHVNDNKEFSFTMITVDQVHKELKNINIKKSTGYDGIPPKLIQLGAKEISPILTHVLNQSISVMNTFPSNMKLSEISPLLKKNDSMNVTNYRPVSIVVILSKVFEHIIAEQMMTYFNDLFHSNMCAYRKGYSCDTVLLSLMEQIKRDLDNKHYVSIILMDLSKAFDCMSHSLLLAKLRNYGFMQNACSFIASYLINRYQRVKICDKKSSWKKITRGVPQGSGLGPLLFNIFINDLFFFIKECTLYNYADDNTLSASNVNKATMLKSVCNDSKRAIQWFENNGMKVNPDKFQFMIMSPVKEKEESLVKLSNECILRPTNCVKLLGVHIDQQLTMNKHIIVICNKAAQQINALYRVAKYIPCKDRLLIYNSFVASNFRYCNIVWHFSNKKNIIKLERVNKRALRCVFNDQQSSYRLMLEQNNIDTLYAQRMINIMIMAFKMYNGLCPSQLNVLLKKKTVMYNLRDDQRVNLPNYSTVKYGKHCFSYIAAHLWNCLPYSIKSYKDITTFKRKCKYKCLQCICETCNPQFNV